MRCSRKTCSIFSALIALGILLTGGQIFAQCQNPFDVSGEWSSQIRTPAVMFALQLTDQQIAAVDKALQQNPHSPDGVINQVRRILLPVQLRRLEIVIWRTQGAYALMNPLVYTSLRLSDRQLDSLHNAANANEAEARRVAKVVARTNFRSNDDIANYLASYRRKADQRLLAMLTPWQRETFQFLLSNPQQFY